MKGKRDPTLLKWVPLGLLGSLAAAILALLAAGWLGTTSEALATPSSAPQSGSPLISSSDEECLNCHSKPGLAMTLGNGKTLSLYVDEETFGQSVHGGKLDCSDCHVRNQTYPHTPVEVYSARDFARAEYELCKRCHFRNYTLTLDSIHYEAMASGNKTAPLCTDCHTAHSVQKLEGARTEIAKTCSKCHAEIYQEYEESVHGTALRYEDIPEVPVCTTCHGVHNIHSATTASFRLASVDLCAGCHGDKEMMDKFGISTNVLKTYLDDFHGKTIGFYQEQNSVVWPKTPVCTDCHGVHDIKRVDDPESRVIKANLLPTCRKCHPDATENFPSAWLGHYEPSLDKAPMVYLVKQYYRFLIPIMIGGLILNISLDLWRLARNR